MKKIIIVLFAACCICLPMAGQMYVGAAYYPEHTDKEQVERDAALMAEARFNVARMGDFAWHSMEPQEGVFTLDWLDHAIHTLSAKGIQSLLCTPTAAIPKWMCDAHPEIMMKGEDGRRKPYGRRRHACINHPDYRRYAVRIAEVLAERYKDDDSVIGFQVDNEPATEDPYCYCEECLREFKCWLEKKYTTVEALNKAWGTVFWSETLNSFAEVWLPRRMDNPTAYLDYQRFCSDRMLDFLCAQRDAIHRIAPGKVITTNVGGSGFVTTMDLYRLSDECDVLSFDNYPINVTLEGLYGNDLGQPFDPAMTSFAMQMIRGGKQRPIWVPEAQIGRTALTQKEIVKSGLPRLWNHQQLAYGCRLSVFFPFRAFQSGHEHLMAGVVESDNVKRDKFYELQQTAREMHEVYARTGELLPVSRAAIVRDFQTDWAFQNGYTYCPDLKYLREVYKYYHALRASSVMTDVVSLSASFDRYNLIVVPYLAVASPDMVSRLEAAARRGATIVLTCVTGIRDEQLHKTDALVLSGLQRLAGIEVEAQEALFGRKANRMTYNGKEAACRYWFDRLALKGATALATFSGDYWKGAPAITLRPCGKGKVYYVATVPDQEMVDSLISNVVGGVPSLAPWARCVHPLVDVVELADASGRRYVYAVNFSEQEQTVTLDKDMTDVCTGRNYRATAPVRAMDYLLLRAE